EYLELEGSFILTAQSRVLAGPTPDSFIDASKESFVKDDLALQPTLSSAVSRPSTDETHRYRCQPVAYYWAKWLSTGIDTYRDRAFARLKDMQAMDEDESFMPSQLPFGKGVHWGVLEESDLVVSALAAHLANLGVQPLDSTAAVLAY